MKRNRWWAVEATFAACAAVGTVPFALQGAWLPFAALALIATRSGIDAWKAWNPKPRGDLGPGVAYLTWDHGVVRMCVETEAGTTWTSTWAPDEIEKHGVRAILAAAEARGGAKLGKWCDEKGTRVLVVPAGLIDEGAQ